MPAAVSDRSKENVSVAPGDDCEIRPGFEFLARPNSLRDDELPFY